MLEGAAFAIHNSRSEPCDHHTGQFIGAHIRLPSPHARSAAKSRDDEFPGLLIIPAYQTLSRPGQRHAISETAYEMSMCIVIFDITEDFDPIQRQELSRLSLQHLENAAWLGQKHMMRESCRAKHLIIGLPKGMRALQAAAVPRLRSGS